MGSYITYRCDECGKESQDQRSIIEVEVYSPASKIASIPPDQINLKRHACSRTCYVNLLRSLIKLENIPS